LEGFISQDVKSRPLTIELWRATSALRRQLPEVLNKGESVRFAGNARAL
jgi:hypothetical protein